MTILRIFHAFILVMFGYLTLSSWWETGISPTHGPWLHAYFACWLGFIVGCLISIFSYTFEVKLFVAKAKFCLAVAAYYFIPCYIVNYPRQMGETQFLWAVYLPLVVNTIFFGWPRKPDEDETTDDDVDNKIAAYYHGIP